ncbi:hypothetical protein D5086_027529 [Populus alba]|uniref:Uncharacterized protein n=1 Tax=Populus alba TaxID=43335 RepID=A0ACC4AVN0_POPAL
MRASSSQNISRFTSEFLQNSAIFAGLRLWIEVKTRTLIQLRIVPFLEPNENWIVVGDTMSSELCRLSFNP